MQTRNKYRNHHLKGEQCASQSGKYSEQDCQPSEQFHSHDDCGTHNGQWKSELPHDICGSAEAEDEELLAAMHEEHEAHHNP
jgi:hypothetical protein